MQKLSLISQNNLKSLEFEDHYIIDSVLENLLNKEILILFTGFIFTNKDSKSNLFHEYEIKSSKALEP